MIKIDNLPDMVEACAALFKQGITFNCYEHRGLWYIKLEGY